MYYVEVKALNGPEGDEHYRSLPGELHTRRDALRVFWERVNALDNVLVELVDNEHAEAIEDEMIEASGSHPDFKGRMLVQMYWED